MHPLPQYYINRGYLVPSYHKAYWLSMASDTTTWPKFAWGDPTVKATYLTNNPHWGTMVIVSGPPATAAAVDLLHDLITLSTACLCACLLSAHQPRAAPAPPPRPCSPTAPWSPRRSQTTCTRPSTARWPTTARPTGGPRPGAGPTPTACTTSSSSAASRVGAEPAAWPSPAGGQQPMLSHLLAHCRAAASPCGAVPSACASPHAPCPGRPALQSPGTRPSTRAAPPTSPTCSTP
jgi:hypothetical protein